MIAAQLGAASPWAWAAAGLGMALVVASFAEVEEALYYSILPTATPYARNAIFSGMYPDDIAERFPEWWGRETEGSLNAFEDRLFRVALLENAPRLGVVRPDAGEAVGLQLDAD